MATAFWDAVVPARHRALLGVWTRGRCSPQSKCYKQAQQLRVLLLRPPAERVNHDEDGVALYAGASPPSTLKQRTIFYFDPSSTPRSKQQRAAARAASPSATSNNAPLLDAPLVRACVELLDGPERWLSDGRTLALARATLNEALAQAQCDCGMAHERAQTERAVAQLEALERHVLQRFAYCPDPHGETEERALLEHLGRGVDLLRRIAGCS